MTGVCLFVSSGQDLTRRPPLLLGTEPARRQGAMDGFPKKTESGPHLWGGGGKDCVDTICADVGSIPTSCRLCLLGTSITLSKQQSSPGKTYHEC